MALRARPARTAARSRTAVTGYTERLNLVLSARDYRRIKRLAFNRGTTMKALASEALAAYLDKQPAKLTEEPADAAE